jgi:hypothetical protein
MTLSICNIWDNSPDLLLVILWTTTLNQWKVSWPELSILGIPKNTKHHSHCLTKSFTTFEKSVNSQKQPTKCSCDTWDNWPNRLNHTQTTKLIKQGWGKKVHWCYKLYGLFCATWTLQSSCDWGNMTFKKWPESPTSFSFTVSYFL